MLFTLPVLALAATASAQSSYNVGLLTALNSAGLSSLATVIGQVANTTEGQALISALPNAGNVTVLAPSNQAFSGVASDVSSNITLLTEILSYHVLMGNYKASELAIAPKHSIARSYLTGSEYAKLPNNRTQAVVLSKSSNSSDTINVFANLRNVTGSSPVQYENILVTPIDEVLNLPPTLQSVAGQVASSASILLQNANLYQPLEAIRGITIFLPNDAAILGVSSLIGSLNDTARGTVLANHVINGTVVYSTALSSNSTAISLGGEPFTFAVNSTGSFVTSGNVTAQIVQADIILDNGVAHVVDRVLVNTNANPTAAQSAASVAATVTQTRDVGIGAGTVTQTQVSVSASASATRPASAAGRLEASVGAGVVGGLLGLFALAF